MSIDPTKLARAIIHVLNLQAGWIDFESLCHAILPEIRRKRITDQLREDIASLLFDESFRSVVLSRSLGVGEENEFMARWHFFEGCQFLVQLMPFEQREKILIPGHRFVPFVQHSIYPADVDLHYRGVPLAKKTIDMPIQETGVYYSLVGKAGWFLHLSQENDLDALQASETSVKQTVFDLSPIWEQEPQLKTLCLRCENFNEGVVAISDASISSDTVNFAAVHCAVEALDEALGEIFEEYGPDNLLLPEQIAHAYARMPDWFFEEPPFHFGGYLQLSKQIHLAETYLDSILWYVDCDPKDECDPLMGQMLEEFHHAVQDGEIDPTTLLEDFLGEDEDADEAQLSDAFDAELFRDDPSVGNQSPAPTRGKNILRASQTAFVYRLKVVLDGNKQIYRVVEVHGENTWEELHDTIFNAFDRFDPHLFSFFFPEKPTSSQQKRWDAPEVGCPENGGGPDDAACVRIADVPLEKGKIFYYLFDYGDCWWHKIRVESVEKTTLDTSEFPRLIKCVGKSPEQY